jgi:hypothetical protein
MFNFFRRRPKRVLDWISEHDPRSRNYSIRKILPRKVSVKPKFWTEGVVLDQGSEGACVGYGWTAELLAEPYAPSPQPLVADAESYATQTYRRAKKIDEWPGEDYEGTSVLAGAKIMMQDGNITSYRWCFSPADIRDAVIAHGPVVLGVPWYAGMYSTDRNGLVKVSGKKVGGHCIVITGYHPAYEINGKTYEVFRWRNSWGSAYGINGSAYIKYADLATLFRDRGEACVPVGRNHPRFDVPLD